jgi:hypothetical protein
VRNYPTYGCVFAGDSTDPLPSDFDYDVITEMHVKDAATFAEVQRIITDPKVRAVIAGDEANFIDRSKILFLACDEADTGTAPAGVP